MSESNVTANHTLDARGLACPMPIVKARKEVGNLQPGQVLKVISTDRGSVKDFQGWASAAKNIRIAAQETEQLEGKEVFVHYVEKTA